MRNVARYIDKSYAGVVISEKDFMFVTEYVKDFSARRAAEAAGFAPDSGYKIRDKPEVQQVIAMILTKRAERADIDGEWLLYEAVDNHLIARQRGNLSASNKALDLIARTKLVDAYASSRVDMVVATDAELVERMRAGRARNARMKSDDDEVSFF